MVDVALEEVEFPMLAYPIFALVLKRFVLDAVAANELVVVAEVPVAKVKENACRVVEAVTVKFCTLNIVEVA